MANQVCHTPTVMRQRTGWFKASNRIVELNDHGPTALYNLLAMKANNVTRQWKRDQRSLAEHFGVSVRTVQRWIATLRTAGLIATRQSKDARGYHSVMVFEVLTDQDQRSTTSGGGPIVKTSKELPSSLRSVHLTENEMQTDQPSLFEITPASSSIDGVDSRRIKTDNKRGKIHKEAAEEDRPATPRLIAYWLAGRTTRPAPGVIAGMGKVIKQCLDSGHEASQIRAALDALMREGTDFLPSQLVGWFNLPRSRPRTPRNYTTDPLYRRHHKPSTMTAERKASLRDNSASRSPSSADRSTPSATTSPAAPAAPPQPSWTQRCNQPPPTYTMPGPSPEPAANTDANGAVDDAARLVESLVMDGANRHDLLDFADAVAETRWRRRQEQDSTPPAAQSMSAVLAGLVGGLGLK